MSNAQGSIMLHLENRLIVLPLIELVNKFLERISQLGIIGPFFTKTLYRLYKELDFMTNIILAYHQRPAKEFKQPTYIKPASNPT